MRKLLLALLMAPLSLMALYSGNPSQPMMPERGLFIPRMIPAGVKVGYQFDWVYHADLEVDVPLCSHGDISNFQSMSNFATLTLNAFDRLEAFANFGVMSMCWDQESEKGKASYDSGPSWAYAVGGRAILAYWGDLKLAAQASYVSNTSNSMKIKGDNDDVCGTPGRSEFRAWHAGGGLSYQFGWLFPYGGVNYMNLDLKTTSSVIRLKEPFGMVLGMGVGLKRGWSFNIEGRFINENALSITTDVRF